MKILKTAAILIIMTIPVVVNCYYDSEEYLYPEVNAQCDTMNITYTGSIVPILDNHCLSCHSNSTAAAFGGNIALEDYADVKARADDHRLLGSIAHEPGYSPMPMGASKLNDCPVSTIRIWINSGAPNN